MTMRARIAVIPAAGLGTRFLPLTKVIPKELLPMGDLPGLQLVIEEAIGAGIETIIIVNHESKTPVVKYFEPAPELLETLERAGKDELVARLRRLDSYDVRFVNQPKPLGLGHAVGMARELTNGEPFAVLLPDELMGSSDLLASMLDANAHTGGSVVAVKRVPMDEVSSFGVIKPSGPMSSGGLVPADDMVEKPKMEDAPSDLICIGRYVCSPEVMTEIGQLTPGAGGELQLTDALRATCKYQPFHGFVGDELPGGLTRYDTGNPSGWLEATIEISLQHPQLGPPLRELLSKIAAREGLC
jgi:UTP--glucose-1-phosphate uridylyltransferase